ncbi:hypothetical protein Efla_004833 [Eimeria flavescens]
MKQCFLLSQEDEQSTDAGGKEPQDVGALCVHLCFLDALQADRHFTFQLMVRATVSGTLRLFLLHEAFAVCMCPIAGVRTD